MQLPVRISVDGGLLEIYRYVEDGVLSLTCSPALCVVIQRVHTHINRFA